MPFEMVGEPIRGRDGHDLTKWVQVSKKVICAACGREGGTLVKWERESRKEYLHPWCLRRQGT